jgi:hypothetical protein
LAGVAARPPAGWFCDSPQVGSNSALSCYRNASAFANGASSTFFVAVTIGSGKAGMGDSNNAHIYTGGSAQVDPVSSNDQKTTTVLVNRLAYLSLSDSASPSPVLRGQQFTDTLSTHNGGDRAQQQPVLRARRDVLPAGVTFISASSGCSYTSGIVTCTHGLINAGADATPDSIFVQADNDGTFADSANVSVTGAGYDDPNLTNNTESASVTISEPAPTVHITNPPADSTATAVTIDYTHAGGTVGATACTLDSQAVQCGAASLLITNLAAGPHTFTVTVTGSGATGSDTATWTTTAAPVNTAAPVLSGPAQPGWAQTGTDGTWKGTPAPTFAYQWADCDAAGANCTSLAGANLSSYWPVSSDFGSTLELTVTATNSAGSQSATSAPSAVITAPPVLQRPAAHHRHPGGRPDAEQRRRHLDRVSDPDAHLPVGALHDRLHAHVQSHRRREHFQLPADRRRPRPGHASASVRHQLRRHPGRRRRAHGHGRARRAGRRHNLGLRPRRSGRRRHLHLPRHREPER